LKELIEEGGRYHEDNNLFFASVLERTSNNGLKLQEKRFRWDIGEHFLRTGRVIQGTDCLGRLWSLCQWRFKRAS